MPIVKNHECVRDGVTARILRLKIDEIQYFGVPKRAKKYFEKSRKKLLTNRFSHAILTKLSPKSGRVYLEN